MNAPFDPLYTSMTQSFDTMVAFVPPDDVVGGFVVVVVAGGFDVVVVAGGFDVVVDVAGFDVVVVVVDVAVVVGNGGNPSPGSITGPCPGFTI